MLATDRTDGGRSVGPVRNRVVDDDRFSVYIVLRFRHVVVLVV